MKSHTLTYYKYGDLCTRLVELGVDDKNLLWDIIIDIADFKNGCITYTYLITDEEDYVEMVNDYTDKHRANRDSVSKVLIAMNLLADELQESGIYVDFSW